MTTFEFPWQYNFPPFFTIQPNLETKQKQLDAWCSFILSYYKFKKQHNLDITESENSELFYNKSINRKLSLDGIAVVLQELEKRGNLEWEDTKHKKCIIMWRSPDEWGKLIYNWVKNTGSTNTVCTFYELANGKNTNKEEFHGLENWLLKRALKTLQHEKKAEIIDGVDPGVKFF